MSLPKNFNLRWLLISVALIAGVFATVGAGGLQGLVMYLSLILAIVITAAPGPATLISRVLVLFMGVGGAMVGWCLLSGMFPYQSVGMGWYQGSLDGIGGWATGILVASWRASVLFAK